MFLRLLILSAVLLAPTAAAASPADLEPIVERLDVSIPIIEDLGMYEVLGMVCIDPNSNPPIAYGPCIRDVCGGLDGDGMRDGDAVDIPVLCA